MSKARPSGVVVTVVAAVILACQLKHVHDSTNLSRDIGMVGRVLAVLFGETCLNVGLPVWSSLYSSRGAPAVFFRPVLPWPTCRTGGAR